jgi:hypothetical protein
MVILDWRSGAAYPAMLAGDGFAPQLAHNMHTAFPAIFHSLIPSETRRFYLTLSVLETSTAVYCRTCRQVDLSQP